DFNGKKEENLGVADGGAEVNFQKRVQGILYFEDDYYLRTEGGDVHVAQSFLSRYILRTGDVIEGVAQWREKDKAWALV
ncbi:hypothetical protein GUG51_25755, partial [Xanthomonas citri pv. citri]|nr:hypothetical protein [Xanthomonas citri pv. citri]